MTQTKNKTAPITYEVDKMVFVVTPVHREDGRKSIHDILLDLLKQEN